jgi:hypothetical protein
VFAEETATVGGGPPRSDGTWIFEPGLPRSTPLDWAGPGSLFLARTQAPSRIARDQSSRPWLPSSARIAWCSSAPQPSCGPLGEAAVRGLERHLERGRKVPPRTSAGQHAHDRGEHRAGRRRRRTPTLGAARTPEPAVQPGPTAHPAPNRNDKRSTTGKVIAQTRTITT